jgi:steroid delta-isomerase-like uncharacterized protein
MPTTEEVLVTTSTAQSDSGIESAAVQELAERYGEAWNSGDLEAVLALHAEDTVFQAHAAGSPPAEGKEAVREAFATYQALLPDLQFAPRSLRTGPDFWVLESTMTGTVEGSLEVDGETLGAPGARVEVDCVDVIAVRDGLVARKDTYLDAVTMQNQLGAD